MLCKQQGPCEAFGCDWPDCRKEEMDDNLIDGNKVVAELAALRRDAERYRWLRTQPVFFGWEHDYPPMRIDAEVDYAIEQDKLRKGRK